jgi:S1-C subfamily serine protease
LFASLQISFSQEFPANVRATVEAAITRMRPALVRIHVVSTEYREGREIKMQAVGSGAIISKDGYLITNHHVAGHGARMMCTLWNREEIEAELIGTDPLTDISVLKLKPEKRENFLQQFLAIPPNWLWETPCWRWGARWLFRNL